MIKPVTYSSQNSVNAAANSAIELLRQAIACHEAGQEKEAESLYRAVLEAEQNQTDALHNLGMIALQSGKFEAAFKNFKAAVDACPQYEQYWLSYLNALIQGGYSDKAREVLQQGKNHGLSDKALISLESQIVNLELQIPAGPRSQLIQLFNSGLFAETEQLALEIVRDFPDDALGWKVLGAALSRMGRTAESVLPMQKSISLMPNDAESHHNLGAILKMLGQLDEAEISFRQAIDLRPDYAEACIELGVLSYTRGKLNEAESCFRQALTIKTDWVEVQSNLGAVLHDLGRLDEAEPICRKAIANNPNHVEALSNLGNILAERGQLDDAERCCRQAIATEPNHVNGHINLGVTLYKLGKLEEAEASLRKAITFDPGSVEGYRNLGVVLFDLGRMEEAAACYRSVLYLKPDHAECQRNYSLVKKFEQGDPHITQLRELYGTSHKNVDRMHLCFALGKACEDLKEYDEAFTLYDEGNRLRKQLLDYNIEQDRRLFQRIKSTFDHLPMVSPVSLRGTNPILIVGMPRSGTSLVEQILASHSAVFGAGELGVLDSLVNKMFLSDGANGVDLASASRGISAGYMDALEPLARGYGYVTDKMPLNFCWLGFLLLAQPDIKVIHTIRDPMAVCWSNFKQYFPAKGLGFAYDLVDLAEYYRLYQDLMQFWHERFPGRIFDLNYEQLTENQEMMTRRLLEYCGLPWEDRCLEFEKTERAVRTASAVQVRNKIYKGSSEAWRKFEHHLQPLILGLE